MGSGTEGASHISRLERQPLCPLPVLERRRVEPELQLARERLALQRARGARNSLRFSPLFLRGVLFLDLTIPAA